MANPLENIEIPNMLESERLELRLLTLDMAKDINDAINVSKEDFKLWFDWVYPKLPTLKETQEHSLINLKEQLNKEAFYFTIYLKGTDTCVGRVSLDKNNPDIPSFNIGYWVRSDHTGKGYMSEAVLRLCDFAINYLKVRNLEIYHDVENKASEAIVLKMVKNYGFEKIGVIKNHTLRKLDNTLRDHVLYIFAQ